MTITRTTAAALFIYATLAVGSQDALAQVPDPEVAPADNVEPRIVVAEGNFVFVASDAVMGGKPWAFFDLWRVEEDKIVEHWDVVAPIPAEMVHDNGKF